jgi:hypothetical protein
MNVNPGPQNFDAQATSSETQIVNCTYMLDGTFWCDPTNMAMNLGSYGLDATISWGLTMGGTFVERTLDVGGGMVHTFSQRWAADLEMSFAMSCSGADCASASSIAGITFPCETVMTVEAVNYADPSLVLPE